MKVLWSNEIGKVTYAGPTERRELGREPTVRFMRRNGAMQTFGRRNLKAVIANFSDIRLS